MLTVDLGGQSKSAVVDEFERWRVTLDPMPAASQGRDLKILCTNGEEATIRDVLVGDVWGITGSRQLSSELVRSKQGEAVSLKALPLVREFRIKTKVRRFRTPRNVRMEIGGGKERRRNKTGIYRLSFNRDPAGSASELTSAAASRAPRWVAVKRGFYFGSDPKYLASWQPADFDEFGDPPSVAAYHFASQVQQPGVPVGIITLGAENPPLTWVSYQGMQHAAGFEKERDELNLAYPNTDVCKQAVVAYIETVKQYNRQVAALLEAGEEIPTKLADHAPAFPEPYYNQWASRTETATHTYNFCISPLTPLAVRGVAWIPGKNNVSEDVSRYAPAIEVYAASLAETYGQEKVPFLDAQPTASLLDGIGTPHIDDALSIEFDPWPKSLEAIATQLGTLAADKIR